MLEGVNVVETSFGDIVSSVIIELFPFISPVK